MVLAFLAWAARAEEPTDVSMVQLVATPERYQGKVIRVVAFLHIEFEGNGLYTHEEDYRRSLYKNGVWVDLSGRSYSDASKLNNSYVIAVGTFDATTMGHLGLWSGTLKDVQRLSPWNVK